MGFARLVEAGRVVTINYGENVGKLAVIADILDTNRVLLDGPTTGIAREVYPIKRISLTNFKVKIFKGARTTTIRKAIEADNFAEKWANTSKAKKIATRVKRASLNDFDRFVVSNLKRRRAFALRRKAK
uniref:Large ribosomal subunit protein eL14 domain-containing protein n=1 Tax=Euplotes harpa TaxID=151035 RepID=A0A7S3J0V5_9SPIT